jgi:hypothetical protein
MTKDEALKLALEALTIQSDRVTEIGKQREAITSIKEALAQPEQEPDELTIAYMSGLYDGKKKRPWVGLTDDEHCDIWYKESLDWMEYGKAIEAMLKEKNFD